MNENSLTLKLESQTRNEQQRSKTQEFSAECIRKHLIKAG